MSATAFWRYAYTDSGSKSTLWQHLAYKERLLLPYPPPEMLFGHKCSSRGNNVCLGALSCFETNITTIGTTTKKFLCIKYKLFCRGKIFSEFQISSTVGEMKGTTHLFHLTGWNCIWSPRPIPSSHPPPFPQPASISYTKPPSFEMLCTWSKLQLEEQLEKP